MNLEFGQHPIFKLDPPKRVLDNSTQFFTDYGYKSPKGLTRALRDSLKINEIPHLVIVLGKPKAGKMHVVWDIANRVSAGLPQSPDIILWGNCFSIAKLKGKIDRDGKYGEFDESAMDKITEEFEDLTLKVMHERPVGTPGKRLIFIKVPATTGAYIDKEFFGKNRGITTLRKIARREGPFQDLPYKSYWIAEVATPGVEIQGDSVRVGAEKVVDNPSELARTLENSGEVILTNNRKITTADENELVHYILESANPAVSDEIRVLSNNLAIRMAEKGRFRLKGTFDFDDKAKGYRFYNPNDEMRATALAIRELLEGNFDIKRRVFLGQNNSISKIALDLRVRLRNVARFYYDLEGIRNK